MDPARRPRSAEWIARPCTTGCIASTEPDELFENWTDAPTPRLSPDHLAVLAKIVETGADGKVDGVVR
jgi:hypothetical protein